MPYFANNKWYAQRQRENDKFTLGVYNTKQEALKREAEFDKRWPPSRGKNQHTYKERNYYNDHTTSTTTSTTSTQVQEETSDN